MWQQTTACANRIMTEFYARDVRRKGQQKMPPMPHVYLYPQLREEFPGLPPQTVASLEQSCQRKYRSARYQLIWTAQASLPTYRYPTPFPIPSQVWTVSIDQNRPVVSLRIGDQRLRLRLKSGPQFRRQYRQICQIVAGDAVQAEAAVYQRGTALIVKLVAWLPREVDQPSTGTLQVRTAKDCLLTAVNGKDKTAWRYNGDHLLRWAAEHRHSRQRWSEDAKYENRPVPSFARRRAAAAVKFHNRMSSATHEIAAQLAGYAQRRRFALVEYDDSERGFCEQFPWYRLRTLIGEKLEAREIKFHASDPARQPTPELLAEEADGE
jgi:hypothetical protein